MAAIATVTSQTTGSASTVTSSASAAGDVSFSPERFAAGGVAKWVDRSAGVPLGFRSLTYALRPPVKNSGVYKMSVKLIAPTLETIDPAVGIFGPKLAYSIQAHLDLLISDRATLAERTAFLYLLRTLFFTVSAASDGDPTINTNSPIPGGLISLEDVY